jgi:hypothetical protein
METDRLMLIFCAAIFIGAGIPAALFFFMKGSGDGNIGAVLKRSAETARQPWKKTADDLDELSRRVEALKHKQTGSGKTPSGENQDE